MTQRADGTGLDDVTVATQLNNLTLMKANEVYKCCGCGKLYSTIKGWRTHATVNANCRRADLFVNGKYEKTVGGTIGKR